MKLKRPFSILLLFVPVVLFSLIFTSCGSKSLEAKLVLTVVDGKLQPANPDANVQSELVAVDPANPGKAPQVLTKGFFSAHSPNISWDGKSLLFAGSKKQGGPSGIFRMNLENFDVKEVTAAGVNAGSPLHLPNGRTIYHVLNCTDSLKSGRPLFSCAADGGDAKQITFNPEKYRALTILKDGRILAADLTSSARKQRNILMAMRPDGTKSELFYEGPEGTSLVGNVTETSKGNLFFIEITENNPQKTNLICISYNRPLHSRVNLSAGMDGEFLGVANSADGQLLVLYRPSAAERYAVYGFDPAGRKLGSQIYGSKESDICQIAAVHFQERPKKLPSEVDFGVKTGLLLCQDVNFLDPQEARAIKNPKKAVAIEILGTDSTMGVVPVAEDGSVYLKVIADKPFRIRSLDENGQIIGKSCDWIWIRPNERRGCVGCHEDHEQTPENRVPLAVKKLPVNVPVHVEKMKEKKISLE